MKGSGEFSNEEGEGKGLLVNSAGEPAESSPKPSSGSAGSEGSSAMVSCGMEGMLVGGY